LSANEVSLTAMVVDELVEMAAPEPPVVFPVKLELVTTRSALVLT
jgi:hypothetical protein